MSTKTHLGRFILVTLFCAAAALAQQNSPSAQASNGKIYLDVVVSRKSGPPIAGLEQQDFTVLDNKTPRTITSFKAVSGREAQLEAIVVIDEVNIDYTVLAYTRNEVSQFLRADAGRLAYPTVLTVLTDKGLQLVGNASTDGNALSASLNQDRAGLRVIPRSAGYYGAGERLQVSVGSLHQLVGSAARMPGRKIILWVSPGWPLMSGVRTQLDSKQQKQLFANIVDLSTELRLDRETLYAVDPLSAAESVARDSYYQAFLKGVSKPSQVQLGDLGLQVVAEQSGGLTLHLSSHLSGLLEQALADSAPYYEISFDAPQGARPNEYHRLVVKVAKPGLTARTRQGYYAQP